MRGAWACVCVRWAGVRVCVCVGVCVRGADLQREYEDECDGGIGEEGEEKEVEEGGARGDRWRAPLPRRVRVGRVCVGRGRAPPAQLPPSASPHVCYGRDDIKYKHRW